MKIVKKALEEINISKAVAVATILLDREVSRTEIAEILEITRQTAFNQKDKPLTDEQIKKIEYALGIKIAFESTESSEFPELIELKYWGDGLPCEEKLKDPLVPSVFISRKFVNNKLQRNEENLYIIAMPGDKMDGGDSPLKNGDILLIDTSQTDISISGVYFFTSNNNEDVFVNNFRKTPFGEIVMGLANSKYEDYEVSNEKFDASDINVVGRVIQNLCSTI